MGGDSLRSLEDGDPAVIGARDSLDERLGPRHHHAVDHERLREYRPLRAGEAQDRTDRNVRGDKCAFDDIDLMPHGPNKLCPVASSDEESQVGPEPTAAVDRFDPAGIVLGVDDPHAGRRNDDVVDVRAGSRNAAVVKYDRARCAEGIEQRANPLFADRALGPGGIRLRLALQRADDATES